MANVPSRSSIRKFVALLTTAVAVSAIGSLSASAESKVDFFDDFTGGALDKSKWLVENRPGNSQNDNEQYFSPLAISTDSRGLHLKIAEQDGGKLSAIRGMRYIGGRIQSREAFLYGRIEFRARLPKGGGLWPALWLRTPPAQPFNGEIDVIEGFGSNAGVVRSSVRPWTSGKLSHFRCAILSVTGPLPAKHHYGNCDKDDRRISIAGDLSESYHTYAIDWQPDSVTFRFDGKPYSTIREGVPQSPMVLILNTAVSTKYDGEVTAKLPQWLDVKFVRVAGSHTGSAQ